MSTADEYRKKAAEFEARARRESTSARFEWLKMATGYRKLAELADRNALNDVVYEPPIPVLVQRQQYLHQPQEAPGGAQQQQQPQSTPENDEPQDPQKNRRD